MFVSSCTKTEHFALRAYPINPWNPWNLVLKMDYSDRLLGTCQQIVSRWLSGVEASSSEASIHHLATLSLVSAPLNELETLFDNKRFGTLFQGESLSLLFRC